MDADGAAITCHDGQNVRKIVVKPFGYSRIRLFGEHDTIAIAD